MERLFSEIYNRYFIITDRLLSAAEPLQEKEIRKAVDREGFGESLLFLLPALLQNRWGLFELQDGLYIPKTEGGVRRPLSLLEKRWLKAVLPDPRMGLFLDDGQKRKLENALADVEALFSYSDFYYYDRFRDGDDYEDERYRRHFRLLLQAVKEGRELQIQYCSRYERRQSLKVLPLRLEYSVKNDCFRLLCNAKERKKWRRYLLRLSRMEKVQFLGAPDREIKHGVADREIKHGAADREVRHGVPHREIKHGAADREVKHGAADREVKHGAADREVKRDMPGRYVPQEEPEFCRAVLLIHDERNAMERAMLQFADYRKNTSRVDADTYRCEIFYNKENEAELLIEILSFGPMLQLLENEELLRQLKERLDRQKELLKH